MKHVDELKNQYRKVLANVNSIDAVLGPTVGTILYEGHVDFGSSKDGLYDDELIEDIAIAVENWRNRTGY